MRGWIRPGVWLLILSAVALGIQGEEPVEENPAEKSRAEKSSSIWQNEQWTDFNGRVWTASELQGQVVLLDFWATWCAPCLAELPHLRQLHERFAANGLVIMGVALDSIDRRRLRSFLLRHNVSWPQIHEPSGTDSTMARRFGVEAVPVTLLIDRNGLVVARNLKGRALEAVVGTLLPVPKMGSVSDRNLLK